MSSAPAKRGPATMRRVTCPHCGTVKFVPTQLTGTIRCPRCFTPFRASR